MVDFDASMVFRLTLCTTLVGSLYILKSRLMTTKIKTTRDLLTKKTVIGKVTAVNKETLTFRPVFTTQSIQIQPWACKIHDYNWWKATMIDRYVKIQAMDVVPSTTVKTTALNNIETNLTVAKDDGIARCLIRANLKTRSKLSLFTPTESINALIVSTDNGFLDTYHTNLEDEQQWRQWKKLNQHIKWRRWFTFRK